MSSLLDEAMTIHQALADKALHYIREGEHMLKMPVQGTGLVLDRPAHVRGRGPQSQECEIRRYCLKLLLF